MIQDADLILTNLPRFVAEFQMTQDEIAWLLEMDENGQGQEAIDLFLEEYVGLPAQEYQALNMRYLGIAEGGELSEEAQTSLERHISLLTVAFITVVTYNFAKFVANVYVNRVFRENNITDELVKKSITDTVIMQYDELIRGTMLQTQSFILSGVRSFQKEYLVERAILRARPFTKAELDLETARFKNMMRYKYKEFYTAMKNGNILVSRKFGPDGERVRHYKLDYYADLVTRTTLLNVDRTTVSLAAIVAGERVVEFYLSDARAVQKDREICQEILSTKILGKSILAIDDIAGAALGIMTIDEAMSTPDYAFGPYCRHSVRRIDDPDYLRQIDDMIREAA